MENDALDQADEMLIDAETTLRRARESLRSTARLRERTQWFRDLSSVSAKCETIKLWLKVY